MSAAENRERIRIMALLGIGLDGTDGHQRITKMEEMMLFGGSEETHERMQETAIKFQESLEKRGKRLQDAELEEVVELLYEAQQ